MQKVIFKDLGVVDYKEAWDFQEKLFNETVEIKLKNRDLPQNEKIVTKNHLLFCEHPHVITLGRSGKQENLLLDQEQLKQNKISFYKINRGGDITYHGPGQLVGYPILDLDNFFPDIHKYVHFLEEAVIRVLLQYHVKAARLDGASGVWIDADIPLKARKICAVGVRTSRWVTMHGFAFNINTDLNYFKYMNPCGFIDKGVTSLEKESGRKIEIQEVKDKLKNELASVFNFSYKSGENMS